MTQSVENDLAIRAEMNEIIEIYNKGEDEAALNKCIAVWKTCFLGRKPAESDADILRVLRGVFVASGAHHYVAEVTGAMAAVEQEALILKLDDSNLNSESRFLLESAENNTSQNGEDGIIEKIFSIIGEQNKWCVEFGAYDGKLHSNTYTLIAERGWNGVMIEGDTGRFNELKENLAGIENVHLIHTFVGWDADKDSLDKVLSQTPAPADPDLISIDIDGTDWYIWHELTHYRPRVVLVEFNPVIPNDVMFIQSRDFNVVQGCSLRALIELGKAKGYELVCATRYNGIFVLAEEYEKFGIADNSIGAMHQPLMDGRIFHCYDSKIYTVGMDHLNWVSGGSETTKRTILPDELQLPVEP